MQKDYANKKEIAAKLYKIEAHPLNTFIKENAEMTKAIEAAEKELAAVSGQNHDVEDISEETVQRLRQVSVHYAKKGDLIYPHLKVKYDISGPSDLMWTDDDEIRDVFSKVASQLDVGNLTGEMVAGYREALKEAKLMIVKEENILFPICAVNFSDEEWYRIYEDSKDYAECFGVDMGVWEEAEKWLSEHRKKGFRDGEIHMPGGHMNVKQITEMLNTIPLELTFVDYENINRYFNEGPKIFKRPQMAIDRDVFSCHPPKVETMVRGIIEDFRNNKRDSVPVWMEKGGIIYLVTYYAVRDKDGEYMGVMETIQDMEFAKEYFYKKFKRERNLK